MNTPIEQLLSGLPKQKLSRLADLKIRLRLKRVQVALAWQSADLSLAKGWQAGLAAVLIFLVGLSGTSVYAYSSDKVNRQSRLYPLKRTIEKIETTAVRNPAGKSSLQAKLTSRRLAEARTLIENSSDISVVSDDLDKTLAEARKNIKSTNEDIESIENEVDQERIANLLRDKNQKHARSLEQIASRLPLDDDDKVIDAVATTLEDLEQQQTMLKTRTKNKAIPKTDIPTSTELKKSEPESKLKAAPTKKTIRKETSDNSESLKQMRKRVDSFKKEQKERQKQAPNPKAEKFIENLEKKINQAESSIKNGDNENFLKLYRTTTALTNTGDHFIASSSENETDRETKAEETTNDLKRTQEPPEERRDRDSEDQEDKKTEDGESKND